MTVVMYGNDLSARLLSELKDEIKLIGARPKLAVVLAGNDSASEIYVKSKQKKALEVGIESVLYKFDANVSEKELISCINDLNDDCSTNAILVQLPLPKGIDEFKVLNAISEIKDVDGFTLCAMGKLFAGKEPYVYPCTPKGIMAMLEHYEVEIEGKAVVVVGRSNIVGKPLSMMFLKKNATVTLAHSRTKNLEEVTRSADILVSAVGAASLIGKEHVKNGAVVVDVGINRAGDGKIHGDVDFDAVKDVVSAITPVPKGVGPMTICSLMQNTVELFKLQNKER